MFTICTLRKDIEHGPERDEFWERFKKRRGNVMSSQQRPTWVLVVSILLLLWSLMGLWSFYSQVTMTPETMAALPEGERNIWAAMPGWLWGLYAVAVGAGFIASIGLLLRKAWAQPAWLVSLIAVVIQFGYVFAATPILKTVGPSAIIFPAFIIIVAAVAWWLAGMWKAKGWLE
jgi:hypothetical protein